MPAPKSEAQRNHNPENESRELRLVFQELKLQLRLGDPDGRAARLRGLYKQAREVPAKLWPVPSPYKQLAFPGWARVKRHKSRPSRTSVAVAPRRRQRQRLHQITIDEWLFSRRLAAQLRLQAIA
jgi:hypothetical protein